MDNKELLQEGLQEEKLSPEKQEEERLRRRRKAKRKKTMRVIDRIFGFLLATVIMAGLGGLGLEYVLVKGPSNGLRERFIATMMETRRFGFVSKVFLTQEELAEINSRRYVDTDVQFDSSLIHIGSKEGSGEGNGQNSPDPNADQNPYGYVDEDGDGVILVDVKGKGYNGYMLIVLDPTRCYVAEGGSGHTINMIAQRTKALGGINGGSFYDPDGNGSGRDPSGMTIIDGQLVEAGDGGKSAFAGFDASGILHVGYFDYNDAVLSGIVGGVSFGPPLIINGIPQECSSGINPRTVIGQRADGAVLMLVIDGRQLSSSGATYEDCLDVMLQFGAVNALNLDGGSSTVMYFNGEVINSPSSLTGYSRGLPNAFMFR